MKTLSIITAVESNTLENAATVIFRLDNRTCTVDVTEIPSVGQVMSKYFGTDIRVHSVARDDRGRFVSIKGYEEQLIKVGLESGWITKTEAVVVEDVLADLPTYTPQPVNNIVEMDFGKVDKPKPISRVLGGRQLETPKPMVEVSFVNNDSQPEDYEPDWTAYEDNIIRLDPNHSQYEMHEADMFTNEMDTSISGVVKQACRIFYDYFTQEMYIKTINREQLNKQFAIVWNKNVQLHIHKDLMKDYVFDCIKYYFNEALGNRVFLNRDVFNQVIKKALCKSVELSLVA